MVLFCKCFTDQRSALGVALIQAGKIAHKAIPYKFGTKLLLGVLYETTS